MEPKLKFQISARDPRRRPTITIRRNPLVFSVAPPEALPPCVDENLWCVAGRVLSVKRMSHSLSFVQLAVDRELAFCSFKREGLPDSPDGATLETCQLVLAKGKLWSSEGLARLTAQLEIGHEMAAVYATGAAARTPTGMRTMDVLVVLGAGVWCSTRPREALPTPSVANDAQQRLVGVRTEADGCRPDVSDGQPSGGCDVLPAGGGGVVPEWHAHKGEGGLQKSQRFSCFAEWLVAVWGGAFLKRGGGVMDIAGSLNSPHPS
jgi:hypothetical protein